MYDYGLSTLEQYGLTAKTSARTRGALLCQTEKGNVLIREFTGSEKKLQLQQELLNGLEENGCRVDCFIPNLEGNLVSRDRDGIAFTLQRWQGGRECDARSPEDIQRSVRALAKIHKHMHMPWQEPYVEPSCLEEYKRRSREIRRIRKYIRGKGPANPFEKIFLSNADWFLEKGEQALALLNENSFENLRRQAREEGTVCHGEFTQHNILLDREGEAVVNFGHWKFGEQMGDLYCFMRKVLEKNGWNQKLAVMMLKEYHRVRPITELQWQNLRVRFTYPEKYWKLANYYYAHNKVWVSDKNTRKLEILIRQKDAWSAFSEECFSRYIF